ncbi:MAG TPA: hypothetical protein VE129_01005 [Thermoanaerobaculia bacterium]|nr:hypothetical protein [Thermoanaerobaculia bacterium]
MTLFTSHPSEVNERLHHLERVAADELVLPPLVVRVELDALRLVGLPKGLLEVVEQERGRRVALLVPRSLPSPLDDLGDPRGRDDLVPLKG